MLHTRGNDQEHVLLFCGWEQVKSGIKLVTENERTHCSIIIDRDYDCRPRARGTRTPAETWAIIMKQNLRPWEYLSVHGVTTATIADVLLCVSL